MGPSVHNQGHVLPPSNSSYHEPCLANFIRNEGLGVGFVVTTKTGVSVEIQSRGEKEMVEMSCIYNKGTRKIIKPW